MILILILIHFTVWVSPRRATAGGARTPPALRRRSPPIRHTLYCGAAWPTRVRHARPPATGGRVVTHPRARTRSRSHRTLLKNLLMRMHPAHNWGIDSHLTADSHTHVPTDNTPGTYNPVTPQPHQLVSTCLHSVSPCLRGVSACLRGVSAVSPRCHMVSPR